MQKPGNLFTDTRSLVIVFTVLAHLTIDQLTKAWINNYPPGQEITRFGFIRIVHINNTGAAFGLFQGQNTVLAILAGTGLVVFLCLGFIIYRRLPYLVTKWNQIAYSLIIGGTTGNLIDRLRFGMVTDFIDPGFWPAFNAADAGISIGAVMLAISILRLALKEKSQ
ncbi:MAG: signal peptidase II [Dehalococcoidia bacterium]|nr:signal peptidase II [Dehalococcoidia bacterium]